MYLEKINRNFDHVNISLRTLMDFSKKSLQEVQVDRLHRGGREACALENHCKMFAVVVLVCVPGQELGCGLRWNHEMRRRTFGCKPGAHHLEDRSLMGAANTQGRDREGNRSDR